MQKHVSAYWAGLGTEFLKAAITGFHVDSIVVVMENYVKSWKEVALS
ncbi:MAG: hypothetical protein ACUVQY_04295 [Thermoproteota archaeon]